MNSNLLKCSTILLLLVVSQACALESLMCAPERIVNVQQEVAFSGDLRKALKAICVLSKNKLGQESQNTEIIYLASRELRMSEEIRVLGPVNIYWILDAAAQLSGASVIWSGDQIYIYDLREEDSKPLSIMRVSPELLFKALTKKESKTNNLKYLNESENIWLLEELHRIKIKYNPPIKNGDEAVIQGSAFLLRTIKIAIAARANLNLLESPH